MDTLPRILLGRRRIMVSLYSLIIFFFILVLLYSAVTLVLSFSGWLLKMRASRGSRADDVFEAIDRRTDRLKSLAFNATVVLVLFCITPFVLLYFMVWR